MLRQSTQARNPCATPPTHGHVPPLLRASVLVFVSVTADRTGVLRGDLGQVARRWLLIVCNCIISSPPKRQQVQTHLDHARRVILAGHVA